eukprot:NODE_1229_length_2553_cov_9.166117.p1 GENE.NODE_1229_length_2553_cov_9.166117~~NODE_1229_length_2553_cov_9.166117.p1  ORF type:complete len:716 (+),score=170.89 NODE_1229_length_2553_cov_9.166117:219-2150(+)
MPPPFVAPIQPQLSRAGPRAAAQDRDASNHEADTCSRTSFTPRLERQTFPDSFVGDSPTSPLEGTLDSSLSCTSGDAPPPKAADSGIASAPTTVPLPAWAPALVTATVAPPTAPLAPRAPVVGADADSISSTSREVTSIEGQSTEGVTRPKPSAVVAEGKQMMLEHCRLYCGLNPSVPNGDLDMDRMLTALATSPSSGLDMKRSLHQPMMTTGFFQRFVDSPFFTAVSSTAIIANTVYMGVECDVSVNKELARMNSLSSSQTSSTPDFLFTGFFVIELALRLEARRLTFFTRSQEWAWNLFDAVLIMSSLYEIMMSRISGRDFGMNLSVFRIFRIFRLVRLMKVIRRVPFLDSLNIMVNEIVSSFQPLFWASVLLLIIMYGFAVFFMSGIVVYLRSKDPGESASEVAALDANYSSMFKVVCLLFEAVSGGNDWANLSDPLRPISNAYYVCFGLYVMFVSMGVLNIVTGFFVDGTIQGTTELREHLFEAECSRRKLSAQVLQQALHLIDNDASGTISADEIAEHITNPGIIRVFEALGLETSDASDVFELVDIQCCGEVLIDDYVNGLVRFNGGARKIHHDTTTMIYHGRRIIYLTSCLNEKLTTLLDFAQMQDRLREGLSPSTLPTPEPKLELPREEEATLRI